MPSEYSYSNSILTEKRARIRLDKLPHFRTASRVTSVDCYRDAVREAVVVFAGPS